MKTQTLGLLAILSLGVGLSSFSSVSMLQESTDLGTYGESTGISGHVTVIHKDPQGTILSYQQYDNVILNEGLNCMTEILFAVGNATEADCDAASTTDQFTFIGLLGTVPAVQIEDDQAVGLTILAGNGLDPVLADTIGLDVIATATGTVQTTSTTALQELFTKTGTGGITVGGATIQNTAGDAVFAAKAFGSGDLELNESDTLEITWSIVLG